MFSWNILQLFWGHILLQLSSRQVLDSQWGNGVHGLFSQWGDGLHGLWSREVFDDQPCKHGVLWWLRLRPAVRSSIWFDIRRAVQLRQRCKLQMAYFC